MLDWSPFYGDFYQAPTLEFYFQKFRMQNGLEQLFVLTSNNKHISEILDTLAFAKIANNF